MTQSPPAIHDHALAHRARATILCAATLFFSWNVHAQSLTFQQAIDASLTYSMALSAKRAGVRAAKELQISAGQLPDPRLIVGLDSLPVNGPVRLSLTRDDFTQRRIGWEQEVPNAGKRAARSAMALSREQQAAILLQSETLAVYRDAGLSWLAAASVLQRLRIQDELLEQQGVIQATVADQLAAGRLTPVEVAMVSQNSLTLQDRRDELKRELNQALTGLRRWVGGTPMPAADIPDLTIDASGLKSQIDKIPDIANFEAQRAKAQAELQEAQAARQGDWGWSVNYAKRGPAYADFLSAQLSFEIPLSPGERQEPQIRSKQSELQRIEAEREDRIRQMTSDIDVLLAEYEELQQKLGRLRQQTLPQLDQLVAYALAGYESGREKLAVVIEARKQRTEARMRDAELQFRRLAVAWRLKTLVAEDQP